MSKAAIEDQSSGWTKSEKIIFRFFFIYLLIQCLPLSIDFVKTVFNINWLRISYGDIFHLTRFSPKLITGPDSFINWIIVGILAVAGTLVWTNKDRSNNDYRILYYWLRVVVRYRLALGIIGYGFIKFFPLQAPYPSLSNLNTAYGDFNAWKLFSISLGVVPSYEIFLGSVELLAGILLLFRRTATIGALIIVVFTGNVFMSNLAYEGGEYVYSFYLVTLALFVLSFDVLRIYNLVSLEKTTLPNTFVPPVTGKQRQIRLVLKSVFILFFVFVYGFKTYSGYRNDAYQFPVTPGLDNTEGLYIVSEFRINNRERPYSPSDPLRWKDVVFERWATISIRSNRPVVLDSANFEQVFKKDEERNYELAGSGSRHYYTYKADTVNRILSLENKNKHYKGERLVLKYSRPDLNTIILSGTDQNNDSLHVVLNRIDKNYLIKQSRRSVRKL